MGIGKLHSKQHVGPSSTSGSDYREIFACCWCLKRNAVMKALLLVHTALLFMCVIGYYYYSSSSSMTMAAVKVVSDTQQPLPSSRSQRGKQQSEVGSEHRTTFNASSNGAPLLRLWSSDFHISPIADIKDLLKGSVLVVDKSLSGHCHLTDTCERDLRVITKMNGIQLSPCPNDLRRQFYATYRSDPVLRSVDAFVCTHASSLCELFMPFQRPLIVIASTRYEIGRHDLASWTRWNGNLVRIASSPLNTVAANNRYDQEYIRYFTGLDNVLLLPNICGYVTERYDPTRPEVLLAPARGVNSRMQSEMEESLSSFHSRVTGSDRVTITPIRDLYAHFQYRDLSLHPAIVLLPYQVSFMSLFEFYRMQIPLFVPSPRMLTRWHLKHRVLSERSWDTVFGRPGRHSVLQQHPSYNGSSCRIGDPNDEFNESSLLSWLSLADFYQWSHVTTFDSWYELFNRLHTLLFEDSGRHGLMNISASMGVFALQQEAATRRKWADILDRVRRHRHASSSSSSSSSSSVPDYESLPEDVDRALHASYGYTLSTSDCSEQIQSDGGD